MSRRLTKSGMAKALGVSRLTLDKIMKEKGLYRSNYFIFVNFLHTYIIQKGCEK
jgi:DNA-binding XRE family transcriptional regulator